jgi:hypothetical protein
VGVRIEPRSIALIAAGYVASLLSYAASPRPEWVDRSFLWIWPITLFLLPTVATLTYVLLRDLWRRDLVRGTDTSWEATSAAILLRIVICSREVEPSREPPGRALKELWPLLDLFPDGVAPIVGGDPADGLRR